MNEENKPLEEGEFEDNDPGTSDDIAEEQAVAPAFPVADVAPPLPEEPEAPAEEAAPPAPPPSPRAFPEHYWLLLGGACTLASTLSVWERKTIYGHEIWGGHSVMRTLLMALSIYVVAAGISNISAGRLKGMGMSFITGVLALWLGIKGFLAFQDVDGFEGWSEVEKRLAETTGVNFKLHVETFLAQWGPGVWLCTIGGGIIILIFLKAILFGGKKGAKPAPAPAPRRRGRR